VVAYHSLEGAAAVAWAWYNFTESFDEPCRWSTLVQVLGEEVVMENNDLLPDQYTLKANILTMINYVLAGFNLESRLSLRAELHHAGLKGRMSELRADVGMLLPQLENVVQVDPSYVPLFNAMKNIDLQLTVYHTSLQQDNDDALGNMDPAKATDPDALFRDIRDGAAQKGVLPELLKALQHLAVMPSTQAVWSRVTKALTVVVRGGGAGSSSKEAEEDSEYSLQDAGLILEQQQMIQDLQNELKEARMGQRQKQAGRDRAGTAMSSAVAGSRLSMSSAKAAYDAAGAADLTHSASTPAFSTSGAALPEEAVLELEDLRARLAETEEQFESVVRKLEESEKMRVGTAAAMAETAAEEAAAKARAAAAEESLDKALRDLGESMKTAIQHRHDMEDLRRQLAAASAHTPAPAAASTAASTVASDGAEATETQPRPTPGPAAVGPRPGMVPSPGGPARPPGAPGIGPGGAMPSSGGPARPPSAAMVGPGGPMASPSGPARPPGAAMVGPGGPMVGPGGPARPPGAAMVGPGGPMASPGGPARPPGAAMVGSGGPARPPGAAMVGSGGPARPPGAAMVGPSGPMSARPGRPMGTPGGAMPGGAAAAAVVPTGKPKKPLVRANATTKLRGFYWNKLPDSQVDKTFFSKLTDEDIKLDKYSMLLETMFAQATPSSATTGANPNAAGAAPAPAPVKKGPTLLFDSKRQQNAGIALARVRLRHEDVRKAVLECDLGGDALNSERLQLLLNVIPTTEELTLLRDYSGERKNLGAVEQFFYAVGDIPRYEQRLSSFLFRHRFDATVLEITSKLDTVSVGLNRIRTAPSLKAFLEVTLAVGNFINGDNASRGGAYGFKLDTLKKLGSTKTVDGKATVLDLIVRIIADANEAEEEESETKDASIETIKRIACGGKLADDFAMLGAAKVESLDGIGQDLKTLEKNLQLAVTFQEYVVKGVGVLPGDRFSASFGPFLESAKPRVQQLLEKGNSVKSAFKELVDLFADESSDTPMFFGLFHDFSRDFQKAAENEQKRREKERGAKSKEKSKKKLPASSMSASARLSAALAGGSGDSDNLVERMFGALQDGAPPAAASHDAEKSKPAAQATPTATAEEVKNNGQDDEDDIPMPPSIANPFRPAPAATEASAPAPAPAPVPPPALSRPVRNSIRMTMAPTLPPLAENGEMSEAVIETARATVRSMAVRREALSAVAIAALASAEANPNTSSSTTDPATVHSTVIVSPTKHARPKSERFATVIPAMDPTVAQQDPATAGCRLVTGGLKPRPPPLPKAR
jgi:hypothetical protein